MPLRGGLVEEESALAPAVAAGADLIPSAPITGASVAALTVGGLVLQVLLKARGLVVVPLYAHLLEPHALGVVTLGAAIASFIAPFLHLGLPMGLLVELPHRASGGPTTRALRTSVAVVAAAAVAACAILPWVLRRGPWPSLAAVAPHALAVGTFAAGMALREMGQIVPQLRRQLQFLAGVGLAVDYGGVTLGLLLVFFGWGPGGLLWGLAVATVAAAAVAIRRSMAIVGHGGGADLAFVGSALAIGVPTVLLTTAQWIVQSADRFFLAHYGGAAVVGIYGLGYSVASAVLAVAAALNLLFVPVSANLLRSAPSRLVRFVEESFRIVVVVLGLCVAGACVLGGPVMARLGGASYAAAGRLLPMMVTSYALLTLTQLLQWVPMTITRSVRPVMAGYGVAAVLNLALDLALIPVLGMQGAVLAATAAYAVGVVLMGAAARRALPGWRWTTALPGLGLATAAAIAGWLSRLPSDAGATTILAAGAGVVILYTGAAVAFKAVGGQDFALLRSALTIAASRLGTGKTAPDE